MKPALLVRFLLALAAANFAVIAPAQNASELRVMTFNLRCSTAKDGENAWGYRRDFLLGMVQKFQGDFVGFQEACPDQVEYLRTNLHGYDSLALSREKDPSKGEACPIFFRSDRWAMDTNEHGTFWLSDTPSVPGSQTWTNACPRIVTWARLVNKKDGRGIYFYNTHFDHVSELARQKSATLILERISKRSKPEPVVVTGDLNNGEQSKAVKLLSGADPSAPIKLVETFRAANPDAKDAGTFHGFKGGRGDDKIDYIFTSPELKVLGSEILHDSREGRYPSDHYAVTAVLEFK